MICLFFSCLRFFRETEVFFVANNTEGKRDFGMERKNLFKVSQILFAAGFGCERLPQKGKRPVFEEKITIEKEIN